MLLSIIVPVYNVKDYLPKCVESLLAQELDDCEILLVDDGSTDGESGALCDRYASEHGDRIRALHKKNGGLGDARNYGLQAANGKYAMFVDSDDYIAGETVHKLRPWMEKAYDIILFGFCVDADGKIGEPQLDDLPAGVTMTLRSNPELLLASPNAWNKLWRRSLFTENHIAFPSRVWYEDVATTGKLLERAEKIAAVPEAFYYYVVREGSITRNSATERNLEILSAMDSVQGWFRDVGSYEAYRNELEAMTVFHAYMTASVRVLRIDPRSSVLGKLRNYTETNFPAWRKNPYIQAWPKKHQLILRLLQLRQYRLIALLFRIKG